MLPWSDDYDAMRARKKGGSSSRANVARIRSSAHVTAQHDLTNTDCVVSIARVDSVTGCGRGVAAGRSASVATW